MPRPARKYLDHRIPAFAEWDATYFLTICCLPRGANTLCNAEHAAAIFKSAQFYESTGKWSVRIMLLMPDHLHALVDFPFWSDMGYTVRQWKRFLSNHLRITFQRNFFDHRLRQDESHDEKWKYIKMNPVRAGLINDIETWPYVYEAARSR
jgi:REP-associated tyrosine transposase